MFLARAAASAGSRPSEVSGATTSTWAPWLIMSWMSEICLDSWEFAFVVSSCFRPAFAASSLIDWVSAIRNGFASFSDWENPTTAFFRSIWLPPYWDNVQVEPLPAGACVAWAPPVPATGGGVAESSDLVQPATASATHRAAPAIFRGRVEYGKPLGGTAAPR